jgi:rare lipoprotein A
VILSHQIRRGFRATPISVVVGLVFIGLTLSACATGPDGRYSKYPTSLSGQARVHAKPSYHGKKVKQPASLGDQTLGRYKVGNPYQVDGRWYVPAEQPDYDEVGTASWYGDAFHAKATANGELFDMTAMTAAHKTLPLPSIVEVTHLGNGRRIRVRVNDRGPFVDGRIIDLSRAAARELGFAGQGLARVRVRYIGPAPLGRPSDGLMIAGVTAPPQAAPIARSASEPILARSPEPAPLIGGSSFEVAVGAFSDQASAQSLVDRLSGPLSASGQVRLVPVERAGATLYRVAITAIADEAQAFAVRQQLAILGLVDARVIYPGGPR